MIIQLWLFPEADFADWQTLVRDSACATFADYAALLAAIQADQERQGREVKRVNLTVQEMRESLARHNLPNTPDGRAAAIAIKS